MTWWSLWCRVSYLSWSKFMKHLVWNFLAISNQIPDFPFGYNWLQYLTIFKFQMIPFLFFPFSIILSLLQRVDFVQPLSSLIFLTFPNVHTFSTVISFTVGTSTYLYLLILIGFESWWTSETIESFKDWKNSQTFKVPRASLSLVWNSSSSKYKIPVRSAREDV